MKLITLVKGNLKTPFSLAFTLFIYIFIIHLYLADFLLCFRRVNDFDLYRYIICILSFKN